VLRHAVLTRLIERIDVGADQIGIHFLISRRLNITGFRPTGNELAVWDRRTCL
jgi:hypothetical protein